MKYCSKCKKEKSKEEFSKNKRKKDGLQTECKGCRAIYLRSHYLKNKKYYIDKAKQKTKEIKNLVYNIKHMKVCMDCGVKYPHYVMEFDHRIPEEKDDCIAVLVNFGNKERLLKEIEKCDLVCSNCHRERTHGKKNK